MGVPATLSAAEQAAVRAFVAGARAALGPALQEARLFGSRARGEGHVESDLDIAIIVAGGGRVRRHELYDLAFDIGRAHGVELAPLVIEEPQFRHLQQRERRIALEIAREGIPL